MDQSLPLAAATSPVQTRTRRFSLHIGTRLYLLIAAVLVVLTIVTVVALSILRSSMLHEKQETLRYLSEIGLATLEHYGQQAQSGALTTEEAQAAARRAVSAMRYQDGNYLFVLDTDYRMVVLPIAPEKEGKSFADAKDANGVRLHYELVERAKRGENSYLEYLWPRADSPEPVAKLSTARLYAPWGWVIGTGVYIDDVDATFWDVASVLGGIAAVAMLVLLTFALLITRSIVRPIKLAVTAADQLAAGDLSMRVESASRDETGQLLRAVSKVQDSLRTMSADTRRLIRATELGRLAERADASQHAGEYRQIVEGINTTLDRLVGFLDLMPAPAMIMDRDFTIQYINELGASMGNRKPAQLIGVASRMIISRTGAILCSRLARRCAPLAMS